jgi:hypothetical protein
MPIQAPPALLRQVEALVNHHRALRDEPLLLAIYYEPGRDPQDIFIFEVIEGFGAGAIDPDQNLFEVTYNSTSSFPLPPGRRLRLVLTNPQEFAVAARDNWPLLAELRDAVRAGNSLTVYSDPAHPQLEAQL